MLSIVSADEPAFSMGLSINSEPDTPWLRYSYTSLTTPATTYELNTETGERKLLKRQPVIGYDPDKYVTERFWATARDGARIPVSLVYKKGFEKNGAIITLRHGATTHPLPVGGEPLNAEAQHFVDCIRTGAQPISDGEAGTQVVSVLEYGQRSMDQGGAVVAIPAMTAQPLAA